MFEGFRNKIVAKAHEIVETQKAEESMTFEQGMYSNYRKKLADELAGTGIEVGDDIKVESTPYDNGYTGGSKTRSFLSQYHVTGTFDGKQMEFRFDLTNVIGQMSREIKTNNFQCKVDGVEIASEADAEESVKKVWAAAFAASSLLNFDSKHSA